MLPTDDDHAALALSASEHHTTRAYDALLAVAPLALTTAETALLIEARAAVSELHRALSARRGARRVGVP